MIISLELGLFRDKGSQGWSENVLAKMLEILAGANQRYIRRHGAPALYRSGVRYQREPLGAENWRYIPAILRDGIGDCEDLAAWRVAELRERGENAKFLITKRQKRSGFLVYHIKVLRANGKEEDPSRLLGMVKNRATGLPRPIKGTIEKVVRS